MRKKIYRSKSNRMITGVCGGLGEYFNIDPNIIRLFWLILSISTNGAGIIAYFVSSIIIPEDNSGVTYYENDNYNGQNTYKNSAVFIGIALIIVGGILIAKMIWPQSFFKLYNLRKFWPALLIIAGISLLYKEYKQK